MLLADPVYIIFYLSVFAFSHIIFCLLVSVCNIVNSLLLPDMHVHDIISRLDYQCNHSSLI